MKSFKDWLQENMGVGPYIGNCQPSDDYQVFGACSDQSINKKHPKKKLSYKFKEYSDNMTQSDIQKSSSQPLATAKTKKWKATKDQIISYWRGLKEDVPILIKPIPYEHKGSTYSEDGIRITGSSQFISSVLPRLKELLAYETPSTKLSLVYRETESPSQMALGVSKTSYVFYLQVKKRGKGGGL
jgi:hypothetical protein